MEIFNLRRAESLVEDLKKSAEIRTMLENATAGLSQAESVSAVA